MRASQGRPIYLREARHGVQSARDWEEPTRYGGAPSFAGGSSISQRISKDSLLQLHTGSRYTSVKLTMFHMNCNTRRALTAEKSFGKTVPSNGARSFDEARE